jgi:hypothetical protein
MQTIDHVQFKILAKHVLINFFFKNTFFSISEFNFVLKLKPNPKIRNRWV